MTDPTRQENAVLSAIREALRRPERFTGPEPGEPVQEQQARAIPAALAFLGWKIVRDAMVPGDGPLDDTQRWQVEEARDCLGTWDLARGDNAGIDRERVLADQLRAMLDLIDQVAPKEADRDSY